MTESSILGQSSQFFDTLAEGFGRAQSQNASLCSSRFYRVGDLSFRLDFAGTALLQPLASALEHARTAPCEAVDFSVGLWESESTGVRLPPPPWENEDYGSRGAIRGFSDQRYRLSFDARARSIVMADLQTRRGFCWVSEVSSLSTYVRSSPMLPILAPFLARAELTLVHAGAVGFPGGGVLIAGKSGSGKSTATLSCLDSPLLYGADNYGLVALQPTPTFHCLYSSGKVFEADAPRFPILEPALIRGSYPGEKVLYFLHDHLPQKVISQFPLRAILLPRYRGGRDTRILPATRAQAMLSLAPSSVLQIPGMESSSFQTLALLARAVPAFVLETGSDLPQISNQIVALLEKLNARETKTA